MRCKDDTKKQALIMATVHVVNEIGFADASVSRIAKTAQVSPATLYTYFANKDDLIKGTYSSVMEHMAAGLFSGLDLERPVRDVLHSIWHNIFDFVSSHHAEYLYTEQFSKSPYMQLMTLDERRSFFAPLSRVIRRGINDKILKDVHMHMHLMFFFYPILALANPSCGHPPITEERVIETAFELAWDAIRL